MFTPIETDSTDLYQLTRELDKAKSQVFLGKNAAFLGSLMCGLNFIWSRDIPTAATDAIRFWWNPDFFMRIPVPSRHFVLMHELWHVARLHILRLGDRSPEDWNFACDYLINNGLDDEKYTYEGITPLLDHQYDGMAEEDIYDLIQKSGQRPPPGMGAFGPGGPDLVPLTKEEKHMAVNNVVAAVHQAKIAGEAGNLPGDIELIINKFLAPVIPWEVTLMRFFTDMLDDSYTWARPNRRYTDIYLPSTFTDDGRLECLHYYLDVSGSVSDADVLRFNSEVRYVKETLNPAKLVLVLFDTRIQKEYVFLEEDRFDQVVIVGRGGTRLNCVRQHINDTKPTAAIIFSDLICPPMEPLEHNIPVIWVAVGNRRATVPFGELIHIRG